MPFWKKKKKEVGLSASLKVLAAQTLKIASINGLGELDKLENELEEEIRYENRSPAKTTLGRWRRAGHHQVHSKGILTAVVFLNIVDCLLVLGELILDMLYFTGMLTKLEHIHKGFYDEMTRKYPILTELGYKFDKDDPNVPVGLLEKVLNSYTAFHESKQDRDDVIADCSFIIRNENYSSVHPADWSCKTYLDYFMGGTTNCSYEQSTVLADHAYHESRSKVLILVSHKLHYASLGILCILCLYVIFKMVCAGCRFFRSKMQVFDGFVVLLSLVLDAVFIAGVSSYPVNTAIIILIIMLIWRIIRVLNSLIVAVMDKQRLKLKIMYTQKKKISRQMSENNSRMEVMQRQIEVLQSVIASRGQEGELKKVHSAIERQISQQSNKSDHSKSGLFSKNSNSKLNNKSNSSQGLAGMMALGKLAFQAADALAPLTQNKKNSNTSPSMSPTGDKSPADIASEHSSAGKHPPIARAVSQPIPEEDSPEDVSFNLGDQYPQSSDKRVTVHVQKEKGADNNVVSIHAHESDAKAKSKEAGSDYTTSPSDSSMRSDVPSTPSPDASSNNENITAPQLNSGVPCDNTISADPNSVIVEMTNNSTHVKDLDPNGNEEDKNVVRNGHPPMDNDLDVSTTSSVSRL